MFGDILVTKREVEKALKNAIDPETGVSMLDMGLIKNIDIRGTTVKIKMTLTTPFCPMSNYLVNEVKEKVEEIKGVNKAEVELVW